MLKAGAVKVLTKEKAVDELYECIKNAAALSLITLAIHRPTGSR